MRIFTNISYTSPPILPWFGHRSVSLDVLAKIRSCSSLRSSTHTHTVIYSPVYIYIYTTIHTLCNTQYSHTRLVSLSLYIYMHTVYHIISQLFKEVKTLIIRMGCAPFQICQSAEPRRGPMSFKRLRRRRYPPIPSDQLEIIYR